MKTSYPAKILVAWGEAITGNKKIREWLMQNGYPELGVFVFALRNKDEAKKWLFTNNYRHLAATISGAEGNKSAIEWLFKSEFDILARVAGVGDGNEEAFHWLMTHGHREMALIGKKIEVVKNEIERDNNDVHKISQD